MIGRTVAVWLLLICAETVNGFLRGLFIAPYYGDHVGRRISFGFAVVLITAITAMTIRWIGPRNVIQTLLIGISWAFLTFCFEAFLIRPALGIPWDRLWTDYDPRQGGLMAFGMVVLFMVPSVVFGLLGVLPRTAKKR